MSKKCVFSRFLPYKQRKIANFAPEKKDKRVIDY